MKIQDAIKSGRRFRRPLFDEWCQINIFGEIFWREDYPHAGEAKHNFLTPEDLLAEDWFVDSYSPNLRPSKHEYHPSWLKRDLGFGDI